MIKKDINIENQKLKPFIDDFNNNLEILKTFTDWIKDKLQNSKDDASAACNDYLKTLGYVSIAYAWIKVLEASFKNFDENNNINQEALDWIDNITSECLNNPVEFKGKKINYITVFEKSCREERFDEEDED